MNPEIGVLLMNVGTPDSPKVSDVRKYLSEFLNDPRVIDIPWIARKLLVNAIIVPFRAPKSAKIYKQMWTDEGSPLLIHSEKFRDGLQADLGDKYQVEIAMRYQSPSVEEGLEKIRKNNPKKIIVVPMYPQYASSSTGTCIEEVMRISSKWWTIPEMIFVNQFFDLQGYIDGFIKRGKEFDINSYDHVMFSYHGLPIRQLDKVYEEGLCDDRDCEHELTDENHFCYKATCYATTRAIAAGLGLSEGQYTVGFQSRLDDKWIKPYSDKIVEEKAKAGVKNMLVFSPAFVADCLETLIEIGDEYQEIFEEYGGEKIQLVPSLNSDPDWVKAFANHIRTK
ncbi:MAG TPA: ferrochelatase [Flavobacteriales bacterium]|nr:ferrochelatase [Flavobacteriales bacterium]